MWTFSAEVGQEGLRKHLQYLYTFCCLFAWTTRRVKKQDNRAPASKVARYLLIMHVYSMYLCLNDGGQLFISLMCLQCVFVLYDGG